MTDAVTIVVVAGLLSSALGILGCFLVVRRMTLIADAVGHAVLPGVVVGFLVSGVVGGPTTTAAACVAAAACTLAIDWLARSGSVGGPAAIAVVFPALFALGVIGVTIGASGVHLDLDSAIYGDLALAPIRTVTVGSLVLTEAMLSAVSATAITVGLIGGAWRALVASSFDPVFVTVAGLRRRPVDRLLLVTVAVVAVLGFESLGAVATIVLFTVPAATAHLLARSMRGMVVMTVLAGWGAAVVGYLVAWRWDTTVTGMIGVAAGAAFLVAWFATRRLRPSGRIVAASDGAVPPR